jgi:hypothetical protein
MLPAVQAPAADVPAIPELVPPVALAPPLELVPALLVLEPAVLDVAPAVLMPFSVLEPPHAETTTQTTAPLKIPNLIKFMAHPW